ncbi:Hypothetical Protein FCC1311_025181 [Hondaea fermentalgiana]|uniref:Uncharacterized protein n=1 Tax=Hondaea fermentalgiana TaxID=2315210 RepID=A0A2R5GXP5_9STRA|nr:Hypothetical Protein FCC1311_025181 [Hondaea fermentalgiana]|eukprot:GBG33473.1 Hypothetical Protein FCC1311_025181 [Hondaea fermentalgiana]
MSDADCLSYATAALERVALLLAEGKVKPWGTVGMHETCFASQLFAETPLDCLFSRRVPHGGDDVTVNVGSSSYPSFEQRAGSSFRAVMSMGKDASGDDGASVIVNALGQSGSPFSRHYDNMVQPWSLGEYFAMSLKNATANGPVRESCLASDRELCSP